MGFNANIKVHIGLEKINMMRIHDKEVNKIAEFNLLHDIISLPKRTKSLNIHYSPILHGCMNTREGKARFKKF